jgi:hypothetical protein
VAILGFYLGAPGPLHYLLYDTLALRLLFFVIVAAPSLFMSAGALRFSKRRWYEIAAAFPPFCLAVACIAWTFWHLVIYPPNPYQPGYWL